MKRIGTEIGLGEDERARYMQALTFWREHAQDYYKNRSRFEDAFACRWDHQDPSGRVKDKNDMKAWPFDGASDQRVRWGDTIYMALASLLTNALRAAEVHVTCEGGPDAGRKARSLELLLKWALVKMGLSWETELRTLLHHYLVDTPAVAAMQVGWRKKETLAVRELQIDQLLAEFTGWSLQSATEPMSEMELADLFWGTVEAIRGGGRKAAAETAGWNALVMFLVEQKGLDAGLAARVLEGLATDEDGVVEYAAPAETIEGPTVRALRYGDDFCIPTLSDNFDYATPLFRGQWVTAEMLDEMVREEGWDATWAEDTKKFPGQSLYDGEQPQPLDERNELFNIVWCYTVDGGRGDASSRWVSVLSHATGSAFGKRMIRTRRGKWDMVMFRREVASSSLIDARGLAEISAPAQGVGKALRDGAADNALVGSLPPIKVKGSRVRNLVFEPMAKLEMGVNDDALFMQPPALPAAADKEEEKIRRELYAWAGVSDGETDVSGRNREDVAWFFAQMRELYTLVLETVQDNISDEMLAGVTNERDVRGIRREDITGNFGIRIALDPDDLNSEKLMKKLQTIGQLIAPLDKGRVIDTTPVATEGMRLLMPGISRDAIKPPEEMTANDIADERQNFVQIKAGVMPQMDTDGRWNYGARIQFYEQLVQQNPAAIEGMDEASRDMLDRWIQALRQQDTQYGANAQIGRTGVEGIGSREA